MAASNLHFLLHFCFFFYLFTSLHGHRSNPEDDLLIIPVTKDYSTLQYVTNLHFGSSYTSIKLVVDLGGPLIWMNCGSDHISSSRSVITSGSIQCLTAKTNPLDLGTNNFHFSTSKTEHEKRCKILSENRITKMGKQGELVEDYVAFEFAKGSKLGSVYENFLFSCTPISLSNGLASGALGMLALGRTRIALHSQISSVFSSKLQFSLCLSSTNGVVLFEKGHFDSYFGTEISRSLIYTPFLTSPDDSKHDYFINLQSIMINGKRLSLNMSTSSSIHKEGLRGIKLSTVVPYTTMESSIYKIFVKAYEMAAMSMNMKKVKSFAPFRLCYSSKNTNSTMLRLDVPVIELVLQSKLVRWRIDGRNSMVKADKDVICLGFLDGGLNTNTKIVLGGHQLEDVLLQFDVGSSMLGFSQSLLKSGRSCSDFHLETMPTNAS